MSARFIWIVLRWNLMNKVSSLPSVKALKRPFRQSWRICSTSTCKFKTAGPVKSYFREHLGLDWPYGGSQPISSQRKGARKCCFQKFPGTFFLWLQHLVQILCQIAILPFSFTIYFQKLIFGGECVIHRREREGSHVFTVKMMTLRKT